ncbi:MAG: S41 family peptidase [Gammaproteobacteria bacterium]|nr:S41 family peptidase [Gammaproteobacteria bacterium]
MKLASNSCCLALVACAIFAGVNASETSRNRPLFPVAAKHKIPDAERTFDEIRKLILENYYTDEISEGDLYWAAIQGMLEHISPPEDPDRATLWSPEQYERVFNSLRGVRISAGIKSNFNQVDGSLTVTEVYPGSPADGLVQPLDRILRIDGEKLLGKSVTEIDALLNGNPGKTIVLTVVRDIEMMKIPLVFKSFKAENVVAEMLPGGTGYLIIRKVSSGITDEVREVIGPWTDAGLEKLIIDLRGNSGGVFGEALKLAELFLQAKTPVLHTLERGDRVQTFVSGNERPAAFELALLVDGKTASSSEIFAAALQANGKARLVGTATFGKATVEKTFTLENEYRVKFIVGAMYQPGGKTWHDSGLKPDVTIDEDAARLARIARLPAADRLRNDRQLNAAWQLLQ